MTGLFRTVRNDIDFWRCSRADHDRDIRHDGDDPYPTICEAGLYKIVALICIAGQSSQECQPPTARDVMVLGEQSTEMACMRQAQMSAGGVELLRRLAANEWIKFACERKE